MATESPLPADTGLYQSYHDIAGTRLQEKEKRASHSVFFIRFLYEKVFSEKHETLQTLLFFIPFNLNVSILTIFVHVGDGVVALSAGKTIW